MKKLFSWFLISCCLALIFLYFILPQSITVTSVKTFHGTSTGIQRVLIQNDFWNKITSQNKIQSDIQTISNDDRLLFENDTFLITKKLLNTLEIKITDQGFEANSTFSVITLTQDSVAIRWTCTLPKSLNPIIKLQRYEQAKRIEKNLSLLLNYIKLYLEKDENIYGIPVEQATTNDTLLVSSDKIVSNYPDTKDIYNLIKILQSYIVKNEAEQSDSALLNITQIDSLRYKIMIALPVNKFLPQKNNISFKRMIRGRFLITTVIGGNASINKASNTMQTYFQDYQRVAMAIPYQVLITDRNVVSDTSKWITKLYFPVM